MIVPAWSFCTVDAIGLLKIAFRMQKLGRAFIFDKQGIIVLNENVLIFNKNFNIWSTFILHTSFFNDLIFQFSETLQLDSFANFVKSMKSSA